MIRFSCDRCDRAFEVPDSEAGSRIECPDCGDMNIVPAAEAKPSAASGKRDKPSAAGLPPDRGPEERVMFVRPAMFRARPLTFTGLALVAFASAFGLIWFGALGKTPGWLMWVSLLGLVVSLGLFGWWKLMVLSAALDITNKRSTEIRGLFSKATSEVLHDNIRNIQIAQSFWQRIWRVGTIGISSAGQDGVEIQVQDMPHPNKIREVIDLYRPI